MKVAVIAGTPVDTKMGVEFLSSKGVIAIGYSVSTCPEEQSKIQILSPLDLEEKVRNIIEKTKYEMIDTILVYCNSLSAAVDMARLSREEGIRIITPFDIYKKIAFDYNSIGVITANNKSSAGIEKVIQSVNPSCNVIGVGILPMVVDIEKGISAIEIVGKFALRSLMEFYSSAKVDVIILGCTHFPYIYDELRKCTSIPILDPAELMYKMI
ncbi:aspartate/glutamate racemase family protein [Clostridium lacusfryxellense]|uniref:aspartate/glutamate racemase family protein n=1 Tax=Clostridium lacusfryxellense TaxID=205328 RepID=UPI001C0C79A2|nr:aspartate/glutamate racemase family protein [Clostridium lacusfryxellense]MBU3113751.1 aspartate/glutamate racemase family protein [Clostridium lacusfryxellense]